ncbi:MAG: signal peptidase I [Ignavibacteria bacterium]|nr:signal peptidase I [Ignavibacteria bacterium]
MLNPIFLLLKPDEETGGLIAALLGGSLGLVYLVLIVLIIIAWWKIFTKAGKPGWAAIVPIYNIIVLCEIVGRPAWWVILFLIPCVNIVAHIMLSIDLAKSFGKDIGFGIGLIILPYIFGLMLGFGSAQYVGPAAAQKA